MIACLADIENCKEVSSLSGACEHSCNAAFQFTKLSCHEVIRRILKSCIEITGSFSVEELAHIFGSSILPGSALIDRYLSGFAVAGLIATVKADRVN